MEAKRKHIIYKEEFRRQAVGNGDPQWQDASSSGARTGVAAQTASIFGKAYLSQQAPAQIDGQQRSPEQMMAEIRRPSEGKRVSQTAARDPKKNAVAVGSAA